MSYIRNQSHNKISKLKFNNLAKLFPVGKDSFGKSSNRGMFFHNVVLDCGKKKGLIRLELICMFLTLKLYFLVLKSLTNVPVVPV